MPILKNKWFYAALISFGVIPIVLLFSNYILRYATLRFGTPTADALRIINTAEYQYKQSYPRRGYSHTLGELGPGESYCPSPSPSAACFIDLSLAAATNPAAAKSGYFYTYVAGLPNAQGIIESYSVHSDPVDERHGANHYYTDETGVERVERGKPAGKDSLVKEPE